MQSRPHSLSSQLSTIFHNYYCLNIRLLRNNNKDLLHSLYPPFNFVQIDYVHLCCHTYVCTYIHFTCKLLLLTIISINADTERSNRYTIVANFAKLFYHCRITFAPFKRLSINVELLSTGKSREFLEGWPKRVKVGSGMAFVSLIRECKTKGRDREWKNDESEGDRL